MTGLRLKKVIADYKAAGKPFRVAASRGNAQDIHMRGAFAKQGIDINKDVQFVNIPNPSDHLQALRRGEIELICTVEPFATQILQAKAAKMFGLPYDQAAGKLTNLILTRSDVVKDKPKQLEETVRAVVKVDEFVAADKGALIDVTIQDHRPRQGDRHRRCRKPRSRSEDVPRIGARHRGNDARPEIH
jgi:ABC-type nitrate/sulfonate/bicarbonate transport system substrate-binding protein